MVIFAVCGCASCVFCILVRRYTEKRVRFPRGRKLRNGSWSFRILLKIVAPSVDRRWKPDVAERRGQELYGFRVDNVTARDAVAVREDSLLTVVIRGDAMA
nr:hypothetical protein BaRGS_010787 [Batillaria attramentaria]